MLGKIFIVQKRELVVKEVVVTNNTFIKVKDIGNYIFFDEKSAYRRLKELIENKLKEN